VVLKGLSSLINVYMKKIAINKCYGGFGLSTTAIKRVAELKGKKIWFFNREKLTQGCYVQALPEEENDMLVYCFTVEKPNEVLSEEKPWREMTMEERKAQGDKYDSITFQADRLPRDDKDVVKAIEELGSEKASARHAEIKVVEVPDEVEWTIEEYDGMEWVAEAHRTWG